MGFWQEMKKSFNDGWNSGSSNKNNENVSVWQAFKEGWDSGGSSGGSRKSSKSIFEGLSTAKCRWCGRKYDTYNEGVGGGCCSGKCYYEAKAAGVPIG